MAVRKKKRTARKSTALVVNPARSLTLKGARKMAVRKRKTNVAKRRTYKRRKPNPRAKKRVYRRRKANPVKRRVYRRRKNPSSVSGLMGAALIAGVGITLFDAGMSRLAPNQNVIMRAGIKLGAAWIIQGKVGSSIPIFGKYKKEIALVLAVMGVSDLAKAYLIPLLSQAAGNVTGMLGSFGGQAGVIDTTNSEMSGYAHRY